LLIIGAHVARECPTADDEITSALVDQCLDRRRVRPREVGRRKRVHEIVDHESQPLVVSPIDLGILDHPASLIG
jgi:hypothetical protein